MHDRSEDERFDEHHAKSVTCKPGTVRGQGDEDVTGDCVISAVRDIGVGEEITISYIDEGQPLDERRADLADYGFRCRCARCTAEEARGDVTAKPGAAVPRPASKRNIVQWVLFQLANERFYNMASASRSFVSSP